MHFFITVRLLFVGLIASPVSAVPSSYHVSLSTGAGDQTSTSTLTSNKIDRRSQRWTHSASGSKNKAAGGYLESCLNCRLFGRYEGGKTKDAGSLLRCECDYPGRPGGFRRRESVVDLNRKLGNVKGKLTWARPGLPCGGYLSSCNCKLLEGRYLSCQCDDAGGAIEVMDLNAHVANKEGFLKVLA